MASLAALSLGPEVTRVGLYFSGGWAKTAAKFTPVLEAWYAKNKSAQTALVLCSLDRDVRAYDTALATWPGQALPFGDDAVERFADALGVDGVPTLVWLAVGGGSAAAEYAVITAEGVEALAASPESAWPFGGGAAADGVAGASVDKTAEVGVWKILRGVTLSTAAGGTRTVAQLRASTDAVAFYFSAHWCPPCRGFTPRLVEWYKAHGGGSEGAPEVVFVSSDRSEGEFREYRGEQPWLALPLSARQVQGALSSEYGVSGIPTLITFSTASGEVLCRDARGQVGSDPEGWPWTAKGAVGEAEGGGCAVQ